MQLLQNNKIANKQLKINKATTVVVAIATTNVAAALETENTIEIAANKITNSSISRHK